MYLIFHDSLYTISYAHGPRARSAVRSARRQSHVAPREAGRKRFFASGGEDGEDCSAVDSCMLRHPSARLAANDAFPSFPE